MNQQLKSLFQGIVLIHQAEWQLLEEHIQRTMQLMKESEKYYYERFLRAYQLYVVGRTKDCIKFIKSTRWPQDDSERSSRQKKGKIPWNLLLQLSEAASLIDLGKIRKSQQLLNRVITDWAIRQFPILTSFCHLYLGLTNILTDNLDGAKMHLDESLALLKEPIVQFLKSEIFRLKSLIAFQEGKLRECNTLLATSVGVAETFGDMIARIHVLLTNAQLHQEQAADHEKALALVDEALELARTHGLLKAQVDALFYKAQLEHEVGHGAEALELLDELADIQQKTGYQRRTLDIKCFASKVYLSVDRPKDALKQLNDASYHFSGSLKVQFHLSIFFLSNNYQGLARSTLEFLLEQLQHVEFIDLYMQVLFLLAEVELESYRADADERHVVRALGYLQNVTQETIREKRKRMTFFAFLTKFYLELFSFDFDSARNRLKDINDLFGGHVPLKFSRHVEQAKTNFDLVEKQFMMPNGESIPNEEAMENAMFRQSLREMTLNNAMLILQEMTRGPKGMVNLEEYDEKTSMILFLQKELGPTAVLSDHGKIVEDASLLRVGVMFTSVVAQGSRYYEGLFGPLPFATVDTQALIYSTLLPDSKSPDPRYQGKNYCLFVLTFPKSLAYYAVNREKIERVFSDFTQKIEDVSRITVQDLKSLKKEAIKYFSASWL